MMYTKSPITHLENNRIPLQYAVPVYIQGFNTKDTFHIAAIEM
jgi:hypothetical protein